jgi:excinuclease ABC subunit C
VQIVGVAKGETRRAGLETLVLAGSGREIVADPGNAGLHLIQAVRDEAHRFAIRGHRARREKAREKSRLEDIEGVGPRRRQQLIRHFGGIAGVLRAGVEELSLVPGIHRELATRIYDALH